jgi:hypothetical protein
MLSAGSGRYGRLWITARTSPVNLALPVADPPAVLPPPASYLVLPEIGAAVAVRNGPAAGIFPVVYHDLVRWADEHGYQVSPPGREAWSMKCTMWAGPASR